MRFKIFIHPWVHVLFESWWDQPQRHLCLRTTSDKAPICLKLELLRRRSIHLLILDFIGASVVPEENATCVYWITYERRNFEFVSQIPVSIYYLALEKWKGVITYAKHTKIYAKLSYFIKFFFLLFRGIFWEKYTIFFFGVDYGLSFFDLLRHISDIFPFFKSSPIFSAVGY